MSSSARTQVPTPHPKSATLTGFTSDNTCGSTMPAEMNEVSFWLLKNSPPYVTYAFCMFTNQATPHPKSGCFEGRETVVMSVQEKFSAVRETQFSIDGRKMMGYRRIADEELAGNFLVAHTFTYAADNLRLPAGQRRNASLFRWDLGGFSLHEGTQYAMGQSTVKAKVSLGNLSHRSGDQLRRATLG